MYAQVLKSSEAAKKAWASRKRSTVAAKPASKPAAPMTPKAGPAKTLKPESKKAWMARQRAALGLPAGKGGYQVVKAEEAASFQSAMGVLRRS